MPLMAIDPAAATLSKRIASKTGRRASEIYQYAEPMLKQGMDADRVEEILMEVCEIGEGLELDQVMDMLADDGNGS